VYYRLKKPKVVLTEEQKQKIIERHSMGVPKSKLSKDFHITTYKVSKIINNKSSDEEKE
jgi:Mor family transcriptional regulator